MAASARHMSSAVEDAQELARQIAVLRARVAPLVPDMDPALLIQILNGVLRPIGQNSGRRFLLHAGPDGRRGP
jgi:hypothetical protein